MSAFPKVVSKQNGHLQNALLSALFGLGCGTIFTYVTDPHNAALGIVFGVLVTVLALQISEYHRLEKLLTSA